MKDIRYPIGKFSLKNEPGKNERNDLITSIQILPGRLKEAVGDLSAAQLDTPYREGGWTVRQLVHHIADSHMNGYIRFKWALTENEPPIKPYMQDAWANLADATQSDVAISLELLDNLHQRWLVLLKNMSDEDFHKQYHHPESGISTLGFSLALYEWHGRHHLAHITALRMRMNW
jgi:uncharacterized damage-inducible protein DinB